MIDYYGFEIPKPVNGFCLKLYTGRIPDKEYLDPWVDVELANMPFADVIFKKWCNDDSAMTVACVEVVAQFPMPMSYSHTQYLFSGLLHASNFVISHASFLVLLLMAFGLARLNKLRNLLVTLPPLNAPLPSAIDIAMPSPCSHP